MTGIIWFVQLVHYPLFAAVGAQQFGAYAERHARLTTLVVAPPMLLELASALLIVLRPPNLVTPTEAWLGLSLVIIIWLSTAALQVPAHNALRRGFNSRAHRLLVVGNWLRTAAWSLRSLLVGGWLWRLVILA
jgi:uncharacterized membrane protein